MNTRKRCEPTTRSSPVCTRRAKSRVDSTARTVWAAIRSPSVSCLVVSRPSTPSNSSNKVRSKCSPTPSRLLGWHLSLAFPSLYMCE